MKFLLPCLAAGLLLASPQLLEAKITRTVEKTFAVQPGGRLTASTQGGDIVIQSADITEVRITARQTIRASTEAEADEVLQDLKLRLEQTGNDVLAEAKVDAKKGGFFGNWSNRVTVDFTVTVPKAFNLALNTSGGDIRVADLKGNVRGRTSGGDLHFERIEGEVDAGTSGGDVFLKEGTARAKLSTSGGDILVERAGGPTEVSTSGGDIVLRSVAELVSASTSGGDIKAVITGPLTQDTTLGTSGGDVRVTLPKSAAFQLDASTSGGDVDAAGLTITIDKGGVGKKSLAGSVNGGGPRLKLRSSGGDITIRAE